MCLLTFRYFRRSRDMYALNSFAGQFFYFANSYFPDSFAMEGYTVLSGFNYVNVFDGVIYGIGMLILAEVFALGLRQKEELDLTV